MDSTNVPARFQIPWGNSAGGAFIRDIPQASQIGLQNGAASLTDGFPPLNFDPRSAGGVPPFGQDFNGILRQITRWARWAAAGGPIIFDATFAAAIGGYPKGALLVASPGLDHLWQSTIDNNTGNPDAGGGGWIDPSLRHSATIFTTSTGITLNPNSFAIGLLRTAAVTATAVALPTTAAGLQVGQEIEVADLAGNFNAFPVTVTPQAGHTIAGLASYIMNVDRMVGKFRYYGSAIWSVSVSP